MKTQGNTSMEVTHAVATGITCVGAARGKGARQARRLVGQAMARVREARGMTQSELGDRLTPRVKRDTISRYERGTRSPDVVQLLQLAVILEASVDVLLGRVCG